MPTRKVSERERLTMWARGASDDAIEEAWEILAIERRVRASAAKPRVAATTRKATTKKAAPAAEKVEDTDQANG